MSDLLSKADDILEDAIIELRALQSMSDSKWRIDELEVLIGRLESLRLDIDEVLEP